MIAQFAIRMIFGMSLMWAVMPRKDVSVGFFRIQMLIAMGLGVLATLTFGEFTAAPERSALLPVNYGTGCCIAACVLAFFGSAIWTLGMRTAGTVFVFLIAILTGATLVGSTLSEDLLSTDWLFVGSEIATAGTLGGAMTGMLLGHWYLTAPTMSIQPLSLLNRYFGVALLLRLVFSAIALWLGFSEVQNSTHWVWLMLRWLAGIVGPLVLVVMVAKILRYKNTQSATGVLFVGVILTFIGELSATLLSRELGWPF